jgi:hypothetical protein
MHRYRVVAIAEAIAGFVRAEHVSPIYRHPAHTEVATGYGPCRLCLRTFEIGRERRILFTYDAFFHAKERFPLPGPVFVHEAACERYPEDAGFPGDLRSHRLTLDAYGRGRTVRGETRVESGMAEAAIEALLDNTEIDYIHVRDTDAGCFDFAVERASVRFE